MTFEQQLLLIYTVTTVIQVVVVAISLIFIYGQARNARRSVDRLEETIRLNSYMDHRRDALAVNRLLLDDPELAKLLGYEKEEIMAFIFIGHAETMFRQKHESIVSDAVWHSQKRLIHKIFNMPFVVRLWDEVKQEYTPDFVDFAEGERKTEAPTLRSTIHIAL